MKNNTNLTGTLVHNTLNASYDRLQFGTSMTCLYECLS